MTELHIKPRGYRILVKADEVETVSAGGIQLVLDQKLERAAQMRGELVAIGEYAWDNYKTPWGEVGDYILFSKHAGKIIEDPVTGEDYVIMNDEDLIAVLERKQDD